MRFELRKIYADVLAPDGTVCLMYLAWVRLWRRWYASAGVEIHAPDGGQQVLHARAVPPPVASDARISELPLQLDLVDGTRFRIDYESASAPWTPPLSACPDLLWSVKMPRGAARVRHGDRELFGTGYVDWVQMTRPSRALGLQRLEWGRVHQPSRTIVFERLQLAGGAVWGPALLIGHDGNVSATTTGVDVHDDGSARVRFDVDELVDITPIRVLHDGDAFDRARVPRLIDRTVCKVLGGAHWQRRWLGDTRGGGLALYESVLFGREARRQAARARSLACGARA